MKYRREIDGLRAVAVIPVILFHAGFEIFRGGYVGVDVFFVISGYLITCILIDELERGEFSISRFYERRARRILPALFVVMLACLPAAWLLLLPAEFKDFSQSLVAVSLFVSNIFFWHESGYFDTIAEFKPLLHTWSLAVEEQYYILFPLFLLAAWRFGKRLIKIQLLMVFILSLGLAQWSVGSHPSATFFLLPTRAWELILGSFVALYANVNSREVQPGYENALSAIGLIAIVCPMFLYGKTTPYPSLYALVPTTGAALVILFCRQKTISYWILTLKPLVMIGLLSYSMYLWHQPIFVFYRYWRFPEPNQSEFFWLLFLVMLLSFLTFRFVEVPSKKVKISRVRILWISFAASIGFLGNV